MDKNSPNTSYQIGLSGHLLFIVLTILSLVFFKERIVFIDCAFHVFQFITQGDFQIWNQRFIAVLTQIVPMLGVQEGWSLSTVLLSYSLSFALLYYFYFKIFNSSIFHHSTNKIKNISSLIHHLVVILINQIYQRLKKGQLNRFLQFYI